jgi:hypothetical protein
MSEMLRDFGRDSVVVKGANAIDPDGNAAVFMAHPEGGTIGWSIGTIVARGVRLIVPAGLEKLIPSVKTAVALCGQATLDHSQGLKVGLMPLSGAKLVTEIDALRILAGVESHHVASGGNHGSEGAVTLVAEGSPPMVEKAVAIAQSVKGEPSLETRKGICETCVPSSPAQSKGYQMDPAVRRCQFQGMTEQELPEYLRGR